MKNVILANISRGHYFYLFETEEDFEIFKAAKEWTSKSRKKLKELLEVETDEELADEILCLDEDLAWNTIQTDVPGYDCFLTKEEVKDFCKRHDLNILKEENVRQR